MGAAVAWAGVATCFGARVRRQETGELFGLFRVCRLKFCGRNGRAPPPKKVLPYHPLKLLRYGRGLVKSNLRAACVLPHGKEYYYGQGLPS